MNKMCALEEKMYSTYMCVNVKQYGTPVNLMLFVCVLYECQFVKRTGYERASRMSPVVAALEKQTVHLPWICFITLFIAKHCNTSVCESE